MKFRVRFNASYPDAGSFYTFDAAASAIRARHPYAVFNNGTLIPPVLIERGTRLPFWSGTDGPEYPPNKSVGYVEGV